MSEDSRGDSKGIGSQLEIAAEDISDRARRCLKDRETGSPEKKLSDYNSHVQASLDFKVVLKKINEASVQGSLTDDRIMCYQATIPVWLQRTGVVLTDWKAYKSLHCQTMLELPDCDPGKACIISPHYPDPPPSS